MTSSAVVARTLVLALAFERGASADPSADPRVTWAVLPTPTTPEGELLMEPRGVWTQEGTLHGYNGSIRLRLATRRPWMGIRLTSLGSSTAVAGGEERPEPRSDDSDATYELASTALFDAAGKPQWLRRWTQRPVEVSKTVLQVGPGPGATFFVAGMYWGCTTFGGPGKRHCAFEDPQHESDFCFDDTGCQEPFRLQYDGTGRLLDVRTFPRTSGQPRIGPAGEIAIFGVFRQAFDVTVGKKRFHADAGRPRRPPPRIGVNQGVILYYDQRASLKWGRAIVADRPVALDQAVFARDGALWALIGVKGEAPSTSTVPLPSPVLMVGGARPQMLFDDERPCLTLLRLDGTGAGVARHGVCSDRLGDDSPSDARLTASRDDGVFVIFPRLGDAALDSAKLGPEAITVVGVDQGPGKGKSPGGGHGGAVLWFRGDHAVWGLRLRGPTGSRIRDAFDPEPGRVCVLFDLADGETLAAGGARSRRDAAQGANTAIGCFPVPVPAQGPVAPASSR